MHQELKNLNAIYLDENGLIAIRNDLLSLDVNQDLIKEYIDMVNVTNSYLRGGIISMDKNLNIKPFTIEEIAERVYEFDKNNESKQFLSRAATLGVTSLVELNRRELENIMKTQLTFNPRGAYSFTVGWWVGKVRVNGSWDYKVKSGYSPWYKNFTMHLYNGAVEVHNSKWLGNYNYGYTGQYLFSLSILHAGGDAISYMLNWEPDTQTVKNTISRGFNDAKRYY